MLINQKNNYFLTRIQLKDILQVFNSNLLF